MAADLGMQLDDMCPDLDFYVSPPLSGPAAPALPRAFQSSPFAPAAFPGLPASAAQASVPHARRAGFHCAAFGAFPASSASAPAVETAAWAHPAFFFRALQAAIGLPPCFAGPPDFAAGFVRFAGSGSAPGLPVFAAGYAVWHPRSAADHDNQHVWHPRFAAGHDSPHDAGRSLPPARPGCLALTAGDAPGPGI